ncbi:MAG: OmpA family protein [Micropepsaceae bacterium]
MNTRSLLLGAAAALAFCIPVQASMPNGWYLSLEGGANWVQDWDFKTVTSPGGGTSAGSLDFDIGWAILATVGYGQGHWAAEFETGFRHNKFDQITIDGALTSYDHIKLDETSFMANLKYNYPVTQKITLTVGGGIGADYAKLHLASSGNGTEDSDWNFAYQGIASVGYAVGQRSELFLSYRYFRTTDAQFDYRPSFGFVMDGDPFEKHTATIGFRYYLNGGTAAEPMSAPPESTPVSEPPSEFIIFFGHNKSDLTPAAMDVIREAASAVKNNGVANVKLVGHTDRSGSDTYNQALSMRRANAVKGALVSEGVATGAISLDAKGESEPLVPTADGVREPQNRRVNISF